MSELATNRLAADGGEPVRTRPFPTSYDSSGRRIDDAEIEAVTRVLRSGRLNSTAGPETAAWEREFADHLGVGHAAACSSGTAAIHLAVAALDPEPGQEFITTPISDAGSVLPVLAQNAVPVFADVDPLTGQVDVAAVERLITPRTRAIIAVHLFGAPAPVEELRDLADANDIALIEDCAQAYGTTTATGRRAGTVGQLGCFSLQQSKHITAGDGGIVVGDDPDLVRRARLFADKAWPRDTEDRTHLFLGLNYRMTELQAAVARAQLVKLPEVVADRRRMASRLDAAIGGLEGLSINRAPGASYWLYPIVIDGARFSGRRFAELLPAEGIPATAGYLQRPIYRTPVLADHRTYGRSGYPIADRDYPAGLCPNAERLIKDALVVLQWNENYTEQDVDDMAAAIIKVHCCLTS
ncbi:MAG: DegT/DnrJ/EryC1/StrS family aminotransferase [Microlunatus sp.]|nr:DegT/DnrJ/EryC1/StrS family aminotransferase [Microlunatus sp.]